MKNIQTNKICKQCSRSFYPKRKDQIYCNIECKDQYQQAERKASRAAAKAKRQLAKEHLFDKTGFAIYLVNEAKRAGTVEILKFHTSKSLILLLQLTKLRTSYSGIKQGEVQLRYELSHIYPVAGTLHIGLLHPENLVISTKDYNRKRRSKVPSTSTFSIPRSSLDRCWIVDKNDSHASVLRKIKRYLGQDVLIDFYKDAKLSKTVYNQLRDRLVKLGHEENSLAGLDKEQLAQLLKHAGQRTNLSFDKSYRYEVEVCKLELERFNKTDSVLYWILESLVEQKQPFSTISWGLEIPINTFSDFIVLQTQHLLHQEEYELGFKGKHLIEYFNIAEDSVPTNRLEHILHQRKLYREEQTQAVSYALDF